ncbi:MAG: ADP-forming succinate--CoA ligase subunit beta [Spirochaetaceae bacterium]|jgi:succinyl-CoA synthetase beta subunit|nr:ADP-forming succinate--CoA ligase subunit beta [Spirochaetaceae bacterium]
MKLLEYQAKALFEKYGMAVQKGVVIDAPGDEKIRAADLRFPVVIKAQVQTGGRGKAGGVKFAETPEKAAKLCGEMLGMDIRGFTAKELLVVEKKEITKEWYVSIMLDRYTKSPLLIFSPVGGMDIEETARTSPGRIAKVPIDPIRGVKDYVITYAMDRTGADKQYRDQLGGIVEKLYRLFFDYYTMLVEINPLAIDTEGKLIALDGKVEIDDNALPFLPDVSAWRDKLQEDPQVIEARKVNFLFIPVDGSGDIGVMSNGSGMLMSCIDLITKRGMKIHAALDLGGGATAERIAEAVRIMLGRKAVTTVFICIFGGITRCDEVARGAVIAMQKPEAAGKNLILRMEGTNKEEAARIVAESKLPTTVAEGIPNSVEAIYRLKYGEGKGA